MAQALCPSCSGKGSVDNFVCGFCGDTGFVKSPGGGGGGDGPPLPPGLPITGLLRIFALILVACAGYATFLAYQNAPGSGSDKVFTASITFGLLGLGIIIVVRVLQHALVVGIVLAVLVGIDFAMNDGGFTNGAVSLAGPAAEEVMGWLRYLVLGPG